MPTRSARKCLSERPRSAATAARLRVPHDTDWTACISSRPGAARNLTQALLQAPDDFDRRNFPLLQRLQGDLNAAAVHRGVLAIDADEGSQILNRRILLDHPGQFLLLVAHGRERNRLRRLRNAE